MGEENAADVCVGGKHYLWDDGKYVDVGGCEAPGEHPEGPLHAEAQGPIGEMARASGNAAQVAYGPPSPNPAKSAAPAGQMTGVAMENMGDEFTPKSLGQAAERIKTGLGY